MKDSEIKAWQGENDFALFKASMPVVNQKLWQTFYQFHKNKINIKNEIVATNKLKIIIKATFKLSNKKGFSLMSLRDLSQETKISMGSLYSYIGSKNQLAEMVHQFLPHMFNLCINDLKRDQASSKQQLFNLVRAHIFVSDCLQPWLFFAFMETKHLSRANKEIAKQNETRTEEMLNEILQTGVSKKEIKVSSNDIFMICMLIKTLLQNWYIKHAKYLKQKITCEDYVLFIEQVIAKQLELKPLELK